MELTIGIAVLAGLAILIGLQFRSKGSSSVSTDEYERMKADLERKTAELGELQAKVEAERGEKDKMAGQNKEMYAGNLSLKEDVRALSKERDTLEKQIAKFQEEETRKQREHESKLHELTKANESFVKERERVIREEEAARAQREEERDRMWNDHENSVISIMTDLCKQPQFSFTSYTNTSTPEGFDGSLKPDFMIEFLGQYVIFDAKVSKAKSLQTYVNDQVKKTAEKVKGNENIYKWIFLVVPATALSELRQHHYPVDGYHIFVISPEAIPTVLATFKHITRYEFAEQMDPQQRENIVQHIAELDFHINLRNAADIILSKMGAELVHKTQKVDPQLAQEVALKKAPMNAKASMSAADLKKLVANLTSQNVAMQELVSPHAAINTDDLETAQEALEENL